MRLPAGPVALIQRFGSAASLNIHLHYLVLDGVYRGGADGVPFFVEVVARPLTASCVRCCQSVISRRMKMLTRRSLCTR